MQKEAKARIKINKLLEQAGWRFFADKNGHANIHVENHVKLQELGDNFEHVKHGYVDYLLMDEGKFPLCVLEAKSEEKDPLTGKEQARKYADSQKVRFVILSNGNIHYLWDIEQGNPTRISRFPTADTFKSRKKYSPDADKLIKEDVRDDYIVHTQNPYYQDDPRRAALIEEDSGTISAKKRKSKSEKKEHRLAIFSLERDMKEWEEKPSATLRYVKDSGQIFKITSADYKHELISPYFETIDEERFGEIDGWDG